MKLLYLLAVYCPRKRKNSYEENFEIAFGQHSGVIDVNKDKFELPRFPINEEYGDLERFDFLTKLKPLEYKKVNLNESIGSPLDTNLSLRPSPTGGSTAVQSDALKIAEELLPNELKNNKYMKPQAGITSVSSETEGALGLIKKTTVEFIVHNFEDFDKIYNKYFLKEPKGWELGLHHYVLN